MRTVQARRRLHQSGRRRHSRFDLASATIHEAAGGRLRRLAEELEESGLRLEGSGTFREILLEEIDYALRPTASPDHGDPQVLRLDDLWPGGDVRRLADRVVSGPTVELEAWAVERSRSRAVDPLGLRVLAMTDADLSVTLMAERLGLNARQLHRRCLHLFGYGPRRLGRVRRMLRALDAARACPSLAQVAAGVGYVDQAQLSREVRELAGTTPTRLLGELGLR